MANQKYAQYEKAMTVACINFETTWGDKGANLKKMKEIVTQAADQGNDMIVFPELALSGYECDDSFSMHARNAETIPGPSTEEMAKLAASSNVYVIFGMPERDKSEPGILYISSVVIGPEGILGAYRKIHLSPPPLFTEAECFTGGKELPVFETRFGLIGVQICLDFWLYPELTRILALKGAKIIFNTTASPSAPGKPYFLVQQTGARATENQVYTASANLVGKEIKKSFYGHSAIAGPAPSRLVKIYAEGGEEEEIVSATLNLVIVREQAPWQKNRRSALILEELKKLEEASEAGAP